MIVIVVLLACCVEVAPFLTGCDNWGKRGQRSDQCVMQTVIESLPRRELLNYMTAKVVSGKMLGSDSAWQAAALAASAQSSETSSRLAGVGVPHLAFSAWRYLQNMDKDKAVYPPPTLSEYVMGKHSLCDVHEEQISQLWSVIRTRGSLRHLNESEADIVVDALSIAYVTLREKYSGEELEVSLNRAAGTAAVLGELRADLTVVLASILHEVDTSKLDDSVRSKLIERVGSDAVDLAGAYASLPKFRASGCKYTDVHAENQIQMLVALAADYRALYIRLAERLHTLRVLRKLPMRDEERQQLALEARHVYAPLAHKMGVMKVRGEMEDLAFRVLDPDMFLMTRYTQTAANKAYQDAADRIEQMVDSDPILVSKRAQFRMTYRIKSKYQLFLKMQRKGLHSPNDVRDALGLRLIVDIPRTANETEMQFADRKVAVCYYLVELLRRMPGWEPARDGFKDYILHAKDNGYQSLHQYIRHLALGTNVEVQVRTRDMHYTAELGGAAHWCYKDRIYRPDVANSQLYALAWRSKAQLQARSAAELMGLAKQQLLASRVFVFLQDTSTVLNLPKGTTVLGAAMAIHSLTGMSVANMSVDGVADAMDRELTNGNVISVLPHVLRDADFSRQIAELAAIEQGWKDPMEKNRGHAGGSQGAVEQEMQLKMPKSAAFTASSKSRGRRSLILARPFSPQAVTLSPSDRKSAKDVVAKRHAGRYASAPPQKSPSAPQQATEPAMI